MAVHRLSRLPAFLTRTEPGYPPDERLAGREARVLAEIYLNELGGVDEITIKRSQGALFDNAVIAAIRSSRFKPGYRGDRPVPTVIQIPYVFKMR
jgi:TonB family protein